MLHSRGSRVEDVSFAKWRQVSIALRDISYTDIYHRLAEAQAYNVKMLDGALIQMMYSFQAEVVHRHRLAFFPSPHLEEFHNNPEIYLDDELYAEVVANNIVPVPIRFDYDKRYQGAEDDGDDVYAHPVSHVTLGQYENCRIPVSAPVAPHRFVEFILRCFYHRAFVRRFGRLPGVVRGFHETIRPEERDTIHVVVPG
ncbi:MAG: DUF2290 domain-containing protein [Spirochaetaceae bacterium]|nr:DUF2290 domain-containing protein [Spirochaetaceae bacterium]